MTLHLRFFLLPLAFLFLTACGDNETPSAAAKPPEVNVVTLKAEAVVLTRELPGRVAPSLVAEVRPQVSGIVKQRVFTEGGLVEAGQVLYQLDDAVYRADANSAKAALARAQATLTSARLTARRSAELTKIEAVSAQDNESSIAALQQAQADVDIAKATLEGQNLLVNYARITSPFTGRIGKSSVTQGALVTAAQVQPLATLQQLDPIYVDLTQSSAELLQLRKELAAGTLTQSEDLPVTILLEDGTHYQHLGKMAFSEVTVDPTTGSFALRVAVTNPDNILLPGMYVRAIIGNGSRAQAILVPQQGIGRDTRGNATALVVKEGKVESRDVQVSRTIGDKWLIENGLAAGDKVIVEGLQKAKPGMMVTALEVSPAQAQTSEAAPVSAASEPLALQK
jgi:membrane fusion protein (multidrug efflux system)